MNFISTHARRLPALLLLLIGLLLVLGACSNQHKSAAIADQDRPLITIMAPLHFPNQPDRKLVSDIEELTETRLQIEWVPDEIYSDKMTMSLATNSLKKATFVKHTDFLSLKSAIRAGEFWEIGPYLKDFDNLKHLDMNILDQTTVNGKLYGLYTERPSSRQGIILRKDWLDRLGLGVPQNLEELYEVMRRFTYDDPDGNGQDDTFGLADRNDLIYGSFKTLSSYFGTPNNWKIENNKLIPEFETQPYRETMNFMRRLYTEKLVNQDFAVTSKQLQRNMIISGKAGIYIGSMTDAQRLSEEAKSVHPDAELIIVNRIAGPEGYRVWSIPNYNGLYLFSKRAIKTEEELLAILAFFDRTMDKDISNLMRYGYEGRHYELRDNGVILPERAAQLRVNEVNPLRPLMIADLRNPNVLPIQEGEQLMELAEQLSQDNEKFIVKDPTVNLESATSDEKGAVLYKIITDATYNYILGQLDEEGFQKEVEKWRRQGGEQIINELTEAYYRNSAATEPSPR